MNGLLKGALIFVGGAAVGAVSAYIFQERKFDAFIAILQEENYIVPKELPEEDEVEVEEPASTPTPDTYFKPEVDKQEFLKQKIVELGYASPEQSKKEVVTIEEIHKDSYSTDLLEEYDKEVLFYFGKNDTLTYADVPDEIIPVPIELVSDILYANWEEHIDQAMYVRNHILKTDYEVLVFDREWVTPTQENIFDKEGIYRPTNDPENT